MANDSDEIQMGARIKFSSSFYSSRSRALLLVLSLLFATASVRGQTKIRSLTNVIEGHAVGGVTVDLVGNIYVADFGDFVSQIAAVIRSQRLRQMAPFHHSQKATFS